MSAHGARKVRRFVDLCEAFHLPVVAFVDEPGFMLGSQAESEATIRYGAEAMFAVVQSSVPWASVIVRKTYGVAAAAHFGPGANVLATSCPACIIHLSYGVRKRGFPVRVCHISELIGDHRPPETRK